MISLGNFVTLKVLRKSNLGFMLSDGESEVLLHFKQSLKEHADGDTVTVFIYADKERRLTATEVAPTVTLDTPGYATVVDVIHGVGLFVSINTPKDLMISKDYLPYNEDMWPREGEKLFVSLKIKKDTLMAKPLKRFDIIALHKKVDYNENDVVHGSVCHIAEKGIGILTDDLMYVFVPQHQLRGTYRMGQELDVVITKKADEEYYGTLNQHKELMIDSDKEIILQYLSDHHGIMKLTAKTEAEIVERELKMSRKAFKRAYGGLYKDHVIDFDDDKTFLVKK